MMAEAPPQLAIRPANEGDAERVDSFARAHPEGTPFHLTAWTRAVERGCEQKCQTLIAEDREGEIAGILPLSFVSSPLFGKALVSSAFGVGGGAIAAMPSVAADLIDEAVRLANELGASTVELRGGHLPGNNWHHDGETYLGFARDLAGDDEPELLAIPRKQRAEVRKALANDLKVGIERDPAAHYAVYAESVRNLGTPVFPRALFAAMLQEFGDDADILTVRHEGRAVASVLSLYWRGTVMPYWGGGTAEARGLRANDLMYYALMLHARKEKGCRRFDFGRSKAGSGPAAFKRNWGFEGVPLTYASHGPAREVNPNNPRYRAQIALWKKLPLSVANLLGPLISRGLG